MNRREVIRALSGGIAGLPAVASIERANLQAGDTVVMRYDGHIRPSTKDYLANMLKQVFPNNQVLIIEGGAKLEIVRQA